MFYRECDSNVSEHTRRLIIHETSFPAKHHLNEIKLPEKQYDVR